MAILTDPDIRFFFVTFLILALAMYQVVFAYLFLKQARELTDIWADLNALALRIHRLAIENKDPAG